MSEPFLARTATLAGGCFWCLEAVFEQMKGVLSVESGYSGGRTEDPSYQQVCSGATGHAEVVQLTYDPGLVSFSELLEVFFDIHDPTTLNRQGADVGTQYRSAVYCHDEDQRQAAEKTIRDLDRSGRWADPIVTEVAPFEVFYKAEETHQEYFRRNGGQPYCRFVVAPKVKKFQKLHLQRIKPGF